MRMDCRISMSHSAYDLQTICRWICTLSASGRSRSQNFPTNPRSGAANIMHDQCTLFGMFGMGKTSAYVMTLNNNSIECRANSWLALCDVQGEDVSPPACNPMQQACVVPGHRHPPGDLLTTIKIHVSAEWRKYSNQHRTWYSCPTLSITTVFINIHIRNSVRMSVTEQPRDVGER